MRQEILSYLSSMPHFAMLPKKELAKIVHLAAPKNYSRGTLLAVQGKTRIDNIYVVKKGQLSIYDARQQDPQLGGYIKKGEVFGGITILMNGGISLRNVRVDADSIFYLIPKAIFLDLCARYKKFYEYFVENFSKHIFDASLTRTISSGQTKIFLSGVAPFSFLPDDVLDTAAQAMSMVMHPQGTVLFVQARTPVGYLYILQKGSAERYYEQNGTKTMRGIIGEGDTYGGISMLLNDGISVRTLQVTEDSYFYLLPKTDFLELCRKHEVFAEYFADAFGRRMLDKSYASIISKTLQPQQEALQLFNQPVQQIYNPNPVFGHAGMTIQQAAQVMEKENSSYLIIPAENGHPAGIITESDLARKVIAQGCDIQTAAAQIMSQPLLTVSDQAMVFEAYMAMIEHDIKHLAVTEADSRLVGVLSNRELLSAQGQSPLFLLRDISRAKSAEEIFEMHQRLPGLVKTLIGSGASARNVNRLITTVSEAILEKIMRFVTDQLGPAPVPFVFLILGSEGRREQTLKTDQDNAIVYKDVGKKEEKKIRKYFLKFGEIACDMLNTAGYVFCPGDIMARNPKWCQPLSVWKDYFSSWINAAEAEDLLQASIFFDFRKGYGDEFIVQQLRSHLSGAIGRWTGFLRFMTENALHFKPPLGFFRNFVVESKGEHRNAFDIKSAMMPIVDFARVYALRHGVAETNTFDRLYQLKLHEAISQEEFEELEKAYSFLMQLRFVRQVTSVVDQKAPPDNFINPKRLTRIEQTMLKEIFKRIEKFQTKMNFDFVGIA